MSKYFLSLMFLFSVLVLAGCANNNINPNQAEAFLDKNAEIILFSSEKCSHCKVVEKYISDNNIKDKVNFSESEVYNNKENADFMIEKQEECKIDEDMIGAVPFLWTQEKCYLGQEDIIQFFKDKNNEN